MSFYENGLTWPFYSFIYPAPPLLTKLYCYKSPIPWDWEGWTHPSQTHTQNIHCLFPNDIYDCSPPSLFSIDHFALSSINLQNALFKLHINTLIDLPKCHHTLWLEVLTVVSPHWCSQSTVRKWRMSVWRVHYSLPGKASGFWGWCDRMNWRGNFQVAQS